MYNLSIVKTLEDIINPVKQWIFDNADNPFFWIGVVVIALTIFGIAYAAIHGKDRSWKK